MIQAVMLSPDKKMRLTADLSLPELDTVAASEVSSVLDHWCPCERAVGEHQHHSKVSWIAVAFVVTVHLAGLVTKTLVANPVAQQSAAAGPLRVRLVSAKPEPAVQQAVFQPPVQKPVERKVLASDAPKTRVVDAPKEITQPAESAKPEPSVASVQHAEAAPAPVAALKATAGRSDTLDLSQQAGPREVAKLSCSVPKPEYPRSSRRAGQHGQVLIRLVVNEQGRVSQVEVSQSSGFAELDASARRAALSAECAPYVDHGRALMVSALQPFNFVPD